MITDKFKPRESIKQSIDTQHEAIHNLLMKIDSARSDYWEAKNNADGFQDDEKLQEANQIQANIERLERELSDSREQLESTKKRLSKSTVDVSLKDIQNANNTVSDERKKLRKIDALIDEQQKIIESTQLKTFDISDLKNRRGILLAEISTGIDNLKELKKVDAEIDRMEREIIGTEKQRETAQQTLSGLMAMREQGAAKILEIERGLTLAKDEILSHAVNDEVERYRQLMQTAKNSLTRIASMNAEILKNGVRGEADLLTSDTYYQLPTFGVDLGFWPDETSIKDLLKSFI